MGAPNAGGVVADDLRGPVTTQTIPLYTFFVAFLLFMVSERRYFKFVIQPTDDKPSVKGAWLHHVTRFKFTGPHSYLENG